MKKISNTKVVDKSQSKISSFFAKASHSTKYEEEILSPDLISEENVDMNQKKRSSSHIENVGENALQSYSSPSKRSKILSTSCEENRKSPNNNRSPSESPTAKNHLKNLSQDSNNSQKYISKEDGKENAAPDFKNDLYTDDFLDNELNSSLFEGNWSLNEENLDILSETLDLSQWQYCSLLEITSVPEKCGRIMLVESVKTKQRSSCLLQVPWEASRIETGDIVYIKAIPLENNSIKWTVNNHGGFLVINPDNLISGTSVVGSLFCARKSILSDLYKGIDCESKIMTIGSLIHELFQIALRSNKSVDISIIKDLWTKLLKSPDTMIMLYRSDMTATEASDEVTKFFPKITEFVNDHVINNSKTKKSYCGNIMQILDIEENLWMPQLGLKGKIDVTVEVKLHNRKKQRAPLELKTGRASFSAEHKGQLILYIMMMRELGHDVNSGLLLYLREGIIKEIKPSDHEIRDLIMLRNEINHFLARKSLSRQIRENHGSIADLSQIEIELPEPINHHSACGKCPYLTLCSTHLHQSNSKDLPEDHPLKLLSTNALLHLTKDHISYFTKWTRMLFLEENHKPTPFPNSQLWTVSPEAREFQGRTIANLQIEGKVIKNGDKFLHCFKKKNKEAFSSNLVPGDYIIISTENQFNIVTGHVHSITSSLILVSLNKNITLNFNHSLFHIDTYDSTSLLSFNLTNLGVLLDDDEKSNKLRKLIIDKSPPEFTELVSKSIIEHAKAILSKLNVVQQRAVLKVLTAKDYLLIQGMPGTGKTQTVVSIIKLMVSLKKSVLITSHTHSAVDNVLLKLHSERLDFMRLGATSRIHPDLQSKSEENILSQCSNLSEVERIYQNAMVVGVTCLGSAHALLSRRKFDVCIVDESTQVLQCSVLRPILSAEKFVLIGDPEQLPPVVKSRDAKSLGFDESLFNHLSDTGAIVKLTMQYRMNLTITEIINKLTYKGLLECANDAVSQSTLCMKNQSEFLTQYSSEKWLCDVLSDKLEDSVKFINTHSTHLRCMEYNKMNQTNKVFDEDENNRKKICDNVCEAAIAIYILHALIKMGIQPASVGLIAPYRDQVELLRKIRDDHSEEIINISEVEVNTVDQYQGRDKDIIIYSCTKSQSSKGNYDNIKSNDGEILNDKRRLTVALTRAKQKLIIIGDVETLLCYGPFEELLSFMSKRHILDLCNVDLNFDWNSVFDNMNDSQKEFEITML